VGEKVRGARGTGKARGRRTDAAPVLDGKALGAAVHERCKVEFREHTGIGWDDVLLPGLKPGGFKPPDIFSRAMAVDRKRAENDRKRAENEEEARRLYTRLRDAIKEARAFAERVEHDGQNPRTGAIGILLATVVGALPPLPEISTFDAGLRAPPIFSNDPRVRLVAFHGSRGMVPLGSNRKNPDGCDVLDRMLAVVALLLGVREDWGSGTVADVINKETEAFQKLRKRKASKGKPGPDVADPDVADPDVADPDVADPGEADPGAKASDK
jgi:hypothetical protein